MEICLITPPSAFLLDERVFMSLGILKVAAVLKQAGHHVEHLDLAGVKNYMEVVRDYCQQTKINTFGLTATSPQMPAAMQINKTIKEVLPHAHTILGGPHATLVNAAAKAERKRGVSGGRGVQSLSLLRGSFSGLVAGDGERSVFEALARPGVTDADDPASDLWLTSKGFDDSPWADREMVEVRSYHYTIDGERALSVIFQLGCPFMCSFCAGRNSPFLRRIRTRSIDNAVAEVVHLYDTYGVKGFMALDDEQNVNKQLVPLMRALADAARDRGIEWRFRGFLKAELFTDEQAEAMFDAGFRQVLIGFESGSERILTNIQKKATRADNTRAIAIAKKHNIKVKALMSIGHAGESEETIRETREWLLEVRPDDFDCTIISPYPGCPYYDSAEMIGDGVYCYTSPKTSDRLYMHNIDFTAEAQYYKGMPGDYRSFVWTDHISAEKLVEMRDALERDVRKRLNIPFYQSGASISVEHSMGMTGLPPQVLRTSA